MGDGFSDMRGEAFEEEYCVELYGFVEEMGGRGIYRREVNEMEMGFRGKERFVVQLCIGRG